MFLGIENQKDVSADLQSEELVKNLIDPNDAAKKEDNLYKELIQSVGEVKKEGSEAWIALKKKKEKIAKDLIQSENNQPIDEIIDAKALEEYKIEQSSSAYPIPLPSEEVKEKPKEKTPKKEESKYPFISSKPKTIIEENKQVVTKEGVTPFLFKKQKTLEAAQSILQKEQENKGELKDQKSPEELKNEETKKEDLLDQEITPGEKPKPDVTISIQEINQPGIPNADIRPCDFTQLSDKCRYEGDIKRN